KQFDLATYPKGIYMLEIEMGDGVVNKKLVLQ
ncbi:MAG TPA: T9SS type A sorting domain-containing protein, partial [Flavobacteriales bacterium]|nr:T9SS type A sorting domain-containing protein [Flavobacteriales bacterium]